MRNKISVILLLLVLGSVYSWGQASIVEIGEAVMQCNDYEFAQTLLKNEGLSIYEQDSNSVVMMKGRNNAKFLIATLTKESTSSKIVSIELKFAPYSNYYASLGQDMLNWDYQIRRDIKSSFLELHKNSRNYLGITVDDNGYMSVTFMRELDTSNRTSKSTVDTYKAETANKQKPREEKQAVFEGGGEGVYKHISTNLKICKHCKKNGLEIKLRIEYSVLPDGTIGYVGFRSTGCEKQDEYIRDVIKSIKVISPAMVDGKPVKSSYFTRLNLIL